MISFEDLPENVRTLLRVKLAIAIESAECNSLCGLAQKQGGDVTRVWRDICRKVGQPTCTIPAELMTNKNTGGIM
jgi:hypothetical protein